MHFNPPNQLVQHSWRELFGAGVLAYRGDEGISGHGLIAAFLQLYPGLLDALCQSDLLLLIMAAHTGKTFIGNFAGYIILIEPFKELIQFPVSRQ